jgi:uncharacterized protein YrrD
MDIKIGVPVVAEDGTAGRVERIILHPQTGELEGVVAAQGGMLTSDVVIPMDYLLAADEHGVRVRGTVEQIGELQPFAQSQYIDPPEDWMPPTDSAGGIYLFPATPYAVGAFERPITQPAPAAHEVEDLEPGDVEVSGTTTVYCTDGVAGRLESVVTDGDSDRVSHLIIRRGALMGRDVTVRVEHIRSMGEEGINLTLTERELDDLED